MELNRRQILGGASLAGVSALGGAAADHTFGPHQAPPPPAPLPTAEPGAAKFGNPRIPAELDTKRTHLFRLGALDPVRFDGGDLRQASEDNFPILTGQEASIVLVTLEKGGVREPHWHPSAWEINVVIGGAAKWVVMEPEGYREEFEAKVGDVVFAPQGSMHYFENQGDEPLKVLIVFNASTQESRDDLSVAASISAVPPEVLAAIFGVPTEHFAQLKKIERSVTIMRRQG